MSENFDDVVESVEYGLPPYLVPLARAKVGIGRKIAMALYGSLRDGGFVKDGDRDVLVTLRREYNRLGEANFRKFLEKLEVRGLGAKRIELF